MGTFSMLGVVKSNIACFASFLTALSPLIYLSRRPWKNMTFVPSLFRMHPHAATPAHTSSVQTGQWLARVPVCSVSRKKPSASGSPKTSSSSWSPCREEWRPSRRWPGWISMLYKDGVTMSESLPACTTAVLSHGVRHNGARPVLVIHILMLPWGGLPLNLPIKF